MNYKNKNSHFILFLLVRQHPLLGELHLTTFLLSGGVTRLQLLRALLSLLLTLRGLLTARRWREQKLISDVKMKVTFSVTNFTTFRS